MQADLYRVGFADSGQFKSLDRLGLDDLGGGRGDPSLVLSHPKVKEHVAECAACSILPADDEACAEQVVGGKDGEGRGVPTRSVILSGGEDLLICPCEHAS